MSVLHQADISVVAWANSANRPQELIAVASKQQVHIFGLTAQADKPQVCTFAYIKFLMTSGGIASL